MIEAFYTDEFVLPLPSGHRFPMVKYRMLRDKVAESVSPIALKVPPAATRGQLAMAHCPNYVERVFSGNLSRDEQQSIGFPWSEAMVERSLRSVGATVQACRSAVQYGASANLAGGTHHAKHAAGSGFCVFNDIVVAARVFQAERMAAHPGGHPRKPPHVLVVDLDVHQGDGTAEISANDSSIFTVSLHGASNFPFVKMQSDLDVHLPDGTADAEYLQALESTLQAVERNPPPDLLIYVAGMDAHRADRLGRLALSDQGIERRDRLVLDWAAARSIPVVMVMAGGYFPDLDHLTDLQLGSLKRLAEYSEKFNEKDHNILSNS